MAHFAQGVALPQRLDAAHTAAGKWSRSQNQSLKQLGELQRGLGLETESLADVPGILADQIRTLDGIQSTTSLVAFPDRAGA